MKITFASYQSLSIIHGGPMVQMLRTKAELEKLGVEVSLFDPWKPFQRNQSDLVHLFSANLGTYHLAGIMRQYEIPFVTSSIFFTRRSPFSIKTTLALNGVLKKVRSGIWTNYEFTRQICNWSKKILPNTADEGTLITHGLGINSEKVVVVPNGVEPRFEFGNASLFKKKFGIDNYILTVTHIGPERKNVLSLIRALKQIDHPSVIIGKITDSDYARQCVEEAKNSKQILLIDGLENSSDMLASAYAASSVFVLPSQFETPGIAALEAGLAGTRIVITPHGGTREYFGSFAEYVDPYSIGSIKEGIVKSLEMKKDSVLQEHIRQEFLWSVVAQKTLAVYSSTVA